MNRCPVFYGGTFVNGLSEEAVREGDIDADLFAGDFAWGAQAVDEDAVVRGFDESGQIFFELREPPRRDLALKHGFLHGGQVLTPFCACAQPGGEPRHVSSGRLDGGVLLFESGIVSGGKERPVLCRIV